MSSNPPTRAGHITVSRGRNLLVWGGYSDRTTNFDTPLYLPPSQIWVYDTLLEKWRLERAVGYIPPRIAGCGSVLVDNALYIIGGHCEVKNSPSENTNVVHKLDLKYRYWCKLRTSGDHPLPCDKMTSWMHQGKIFIFGGFGLNPNQYHFSFNTEKFDFVPDDSSPSLSRGWNNQLVVFDRATNCWSWPEYKGPKPIARAAHASAKLGNIIYTFGGQHQKLTMNDMHCLDLTTMTWSGDLPIAEPIPCGRSLHTLNVLNDSQLVLFGGSSQITKDISLVLSDCWIFETRYKFWTWVFRPGLEPRLRHTACVTDQGALIIIGGCNENILNDTMTYANTPITLYFSPKSLLRISIDAVFFNRKLLRRAWGELPKSIQFLLFDKLKTSPV